MVYKKLRQFTIQSKNTQGFTIVELLVVIVVIGVLAAITIVSYTGVQQRAVAASLISDLDNASKQLKLFQIDNSTSDYPNTINCTGDTATNKCLNTSADTTYEYKSNINPKTFCLTATKNGQSYNIDQDGTILAGPCPAINLDASKSLSYSGTGITWHDLSGNGYDMTLNNSPTYNSSTGYISFNGVDQYGSQNFPGFDSATQNYYVEIWFRMKTLPTVEYGSDGHIYGGQNGNNIVMYLNPVSGGSSHLNMIYDDGRYSAVQNSIYGLFPNTWVCWGVNGYTTNDVEYFINGSIDRNRFTNNGDARSWPTATTLAYDSRWSTYSSLDVGMIKFYNKNLSAQEIKQNFDKLRGRYGL